MRPPVIDIAGGQAAAAVQGEGRSPRGGKRGRVRGWSAAAARRHTQHLQRVVPDALTGAGFAFTLTVRDCPGSPDEWEVMRRAFVARLERAGSLRLDWLTEHQPRRDAAGVSHPTPHLHGSVWLPDTGGEAAVMTAARITAMWLDVAAKFRPTWAAQHVVGIAGVSGWSRYLAKHGARGEAHYQRIGLPDGWESTGRMWGFRGTWPQAEAEISLTGRALYRVRRLMRQWAAADARAGLEKAAGYQARAVTAGAVSLAQHHGRLARRRLADARAAGVVRVDLGALVLGAADPRPRSRRGKRRRAAEIRRRIEKAPVEARDWLGVEVRGEMRRRSRFRGQSAWVPGGVMVRILRLVAAEMPGDVTLAGQWAENVEGAPITVPL